MKQPPSQKKTAAGLSMLRSGVFLRTLLVLILVALLPVGILAFIFSRQSVNMWKNETHDLYIKELGAATNAIDQELIRIENESSRIATSPNAVSFIINPSFSDVARNNALTQNLSGAVTANRAINSIYICSTYENLILSSDSHGYTYFNFHDKEALDLYREGLSGANYSLRSTLTSAGERVDTIYLGRNIPEQSVGSLGCVVVNIDVERLFSNLPPQSAQKELLVLDRHGNVVYSQNQHAAYGQAPEFAEHLGGIAQSYPFSVDDQEYIAFQNQSYQSEWTFIGIAPLSLFNQRIDEIIRTLAILMVVILLLCLAVAFLVTRSLYRPLHSLVGEVMTGDSPLEKAGVDEYELIRSQYSGVLQQSRDMEEYLHAARPAVKEWLFFSLIMGDEWTGEDIADKITFIGEGFTEEYYAAITLRITDQTNFQLADANSRNEHFVTLLDICGTGAGVLPHVIVRTAGYEWTMALNTGSEAFSVQEMAGQIAERSAAQLPFPVALGAGRVYRRIQDLSLSYQEALDRLRFRLYMQGSKEAVPASGAEYGNPKLEAELLSAVRSGDVQRTDSLSAKALEDLRKHHTFPHGLQMACANLLNRVVELMISLDIDPAALYDPHQYYDRLSLASTPGEMEATVRSLCVQSARYIDSRNSERVGKTVERLIEYIDQHMGEDISLQSLSEFTGLSTTYVSRIIKEHLGVGFVEYLNTKRIDRAKKLLADTQVNVEQVGFQVGFNNVRSFMRTFKQYVGVSPGSYRVDFAGK